MKQRDYKDKLIQHLVDALAWYIDNDNVIDGMEGNEPWIEGRDASEALVLQANGLGYATSKDPLPSIIPLLPIVEVKISGLLTHRMFGKGSKSEQKAIYIKTNDGKEYVLRMVEESPRNNSKLIALVGKNVQVKGSIHDYLFLATKLKVLDKNK